MHPARAIARRLIIPRRARSRKSDPAPSGAEGKGRRRRILLTSAALALTLSGAIYFMAIPYPWGLSEGDPGPTTLMEQRVREAREDGDTLPIRQTWVPLSAISPNLVQAVIVAEDYRFREHDGVDWVSLAEEVQWSGEDDFHWWRPSDLAALGRALRYVWTNRSEVRGRSTLTQQLAKNLYFGTDRSFTRKGMELVVARRLERRLDKDRILELYLNVVEWGPGIFGAEAAAQRYFGTPAGSLSLTQAAAMAGTLPHPLTSNPAFNPGRMQWRQELILNRLTRPTTDPEPPLRFDMPPTLESPDGLPRDTVEAGITPSVDTLGIARSPDPA